MVFMLTHADHAPVLYGGRGQPRRASGSSGVAIAQRLGPDSEHAEVAADGDEARAHFEIAVRVGLDRRERAERLAGGLAPC